MPRLANLRPVAVTLLALIALGVAPAAQGDSEEPENVRIKLLTPADAAAGLRVFRHPGDGPMDREKMGALMERALDQLKNPDGRIESATGSSVSIDFADGGSTSLVYDEASHTWGGRVLVVVLPQ